MDSPGDTKIGLCNIEIAFLSCIFANVTFAPAGSGNVLVDIRWGELHNIQWGD